MGISLNKKKENNQCYDLNKFRNNPALANNEIRKMNWSIRGDGEIWDKIQSRIISILTKNYPISKTKKSESDKEGLKMNYTIRQANYTLFGLIKDRANNIRLSRLAKIWSNWKEIKGYTRNEQNRYIGKIKYEHIWINQIESNIKNIKNIYRNKNNLKKEKTMKDQIERINMFRKKNDLPSILKEFKKITNKPFKKINELKNSRNEHVINKDEILHEIEKTLKNMTKTQQEKR